MNQARTALTLADIEGKARNYRQARDLLAGRVQQLQDQLAAARRAAEPLIKTALQAAKAAEAELGGAIAESPALFKKPRTVVFHGVKVGIEKGKGQLTIADADRCVALIKKHLPDEAELLIKTTEKPVKSAIAQLAATDLKRIGAEVTDAGDMVVIRPVDSELDKMLDALLKNDAQAVEEDS